MLTRAARLYRVIYVEEPIVEPSAVPRLERRQVPGGVSVAVPVLPEGLSGPAAAEVQRGLIEALLAELDAETLLYWYYTPMALDFTDPGRADVVVYDNMDELSAFRGAPPALLDNEARLMEAADLVFTGGVSLYEAKRGRHRALHAFPSSIDVPHFAAARENRTDPADQAAIAHPRIGFFGVLDERLDPDLVRDVAALRPDLQFVMIGPVVKIDPASLPTTPNIHWLGPKSYEDLPAYLGGWDAGFMPFALNEATRFISPTKTPEFLAAGLPLVSTPIADVVRPYGVEGLVEIASGAEEFAAAFDRLLARPREPFLRTVETKLATTSWDRVFSRMDELVRGVLDASAPLPHPAPREPALALG